MTVQEKIKGRNIGIIGMARSGISAAILADSFGGKPFVSDSKDAGKLATEIVRLDAVSIPYETGGHSERLLKCDYLIVSPGVPLTVDIIKKAQEIGIPVFSEIEFAYWACKGKIIAVTGSNGKTTTTTLIGEIFSTAGFKTFVAGNIGLPFSEVVHNIPEDGIAVIEISNFQLETIADFKPDVALILNLTPDHLDRHGSFEKYKECKYRIGENQNENDTVILNNDDAEIDASAIAGSAKVSYFTLNDDSSAAAFVKDNALYMKLNGVDEKIIDVDQITIKGPHNLMNAAAASAAAAVFNIDTAVISKVLKNFTGVEHRLENVGKVAGVGFINDSKATNIDSVCFALRSIKNGVYLIAGGRDKGGDFKTLIPFGKNKIKGIFAIGEAKETIFNHLGHEFPVQFASDMDEAVLKAFESAIPGDTVMLSPGCASFDMFDNFEHRGRVFKDAVINLKKSKNGNEALTQK